MKQQENCEDKKQTESLADLPVADEQADETKGGARSTIPNLVMADGHD